LFVHIHHKFGPALYAEFLEDVGNMKLNRSFGNKKAVSHFFITTSASDFAGKYADAKVSMLTVDHSIGNEERAFLEKHFDIYPQIPHLDCFIKGEGKAKGMNLILDTLGLEKKYSIAIGDSSNDMDIIQCAGTGIAVGNACEELKEKASWISAPVGEGAVVKALEYLGLC